MGVVAGAGVAVITGVLVSVTVVSPDPTAERTAGETLARLQRRLRCSRLREAGLRVVDWPPGEPLGAAVETARARWSV